MDNVVKDLLKQLSLERLDVNLFRGESRDIGGPNVFGGQVLGQALSAASQTVEGRGVHSLHAYFLRPGDKTKPIEYEVDCIRDGRSYTTRRIVAIQRGKPIFNMSASFQVREDGIDHQFDMPEVPPPEELKSMQELALQALKDEERKLSSFWTKERPLDFRPVKPAHPLNPEPQTPFRDIWFRVNCALPDDPVIHKSILAYASDFSLLGTSLLPHALSFSQGTIRAASLDHAMWFHRDFRMDDWLLYSMDSPSTSHGRGLSRGSIFASDGQLVASVAQEGMIRKI